MVLYLPLHEHSFKVIFKILYLPLGAKKGLVINVIHHFLFNRWLLRSSVKTFILEVKFLGFFLCL